MKIIKSSFVTTLVALLLFSNVSPAFAASKPSAATLKSPAAAPKPVTPAKAKPIAKPKPVAKPVVKKAAVPVVPPAPPVVPAKQNPPPPNTSVIDMINTIPVIGGGMLAADIQKKIETLDAYTDVAYMGNGVNAYRYFSEPRLVYKDNGKLKIRPNNWQLFNERIDSQLKPRNNSGYQYVMPLTSGNGVGVRSGVLQKGQNVIQPLQPAFEQTQETNATITKYTETYPGIDTVFRDSSFKREREIVIKRMPQNLSPNDTLVFWEEYDLPRGAQVFGGDGTQILDNRHQGMETVEIKMPDGNVARISGAMMFDGSITSKDQLDLSPVTQAISEQIEVRNNVLRIGLEVPTNYLLDASRIYPVTIDPTYYTCREGNGDGIIDPTGQIVACNITDYYLRAQNGLSDNSNGLGPMVDNNTDLFMGLWQNGANYTRHAVIKFNTDFTSIPGTVRSAFLKMYYRNVGFGTAAGVNIAARRINAAWPGIKTYANFRNILTAENPRVYVDARAALPAGSIPTWVSAINVTASVAAWKAGSTNYGLLVEQDPPHAQAGALAGGAVNRLLKFDDSGVGSSTSPYLEIIMDPPPRPNLGHTNSSVPNSVPQGQRLTATFTVINRGAAASAQTTVSSYFGANAYGNLINSTIIPALAVNASANVTVNYDIPAGQAVGNYYYSYWIDPNNTLAESNENDNKNSFSVSVTNALRSDLVAENATLNNNSVLPGDQVTISTDVYNRGAAVTNNDSYVYYSFGTIAAYESNRKLATENYVPSLNVNQFSRESLSYTIPAGTSPGRYYLSYFVDGSARVTESNENNNQGSFQITVRAGQDLVPSNVMVVNPRTVLSGEIIEVTSRIRNNGNVASNGVNYRLRLHDINSGNRYSLTNQSPASLNLSAGYDSIATLSGTVPADIPITGSYQVIVELDQTGSISELDENNNIASSATILTVQRNGYCGGCGGGGGGGVPPASNTLPNSDQDVYPDVEEKFGGTNILGTQVLGLYSPATAKYYLSSPNDTKTHNYAADPVNIRTGSFEFNQKDFEVLGRGAPISIVRSYNSRLVDNNNRLGNGWTLSTQMYYYQDSASHNVQLYLGGTLGALYSTNDGGVTFTAPPGVEEKLTLENGNLVYRTLDGVRYIFSKKLTSSLGMIERIEDTFGNTTLFTYNVVRDVPLLATITDPSGRRVDFSYGAPNSPTWDKVSTIVDSFSVQNPRVISYAYDANGNLSEQRESRIYGGVSEDVIRRFGYDNANRLTTYTDPRGTILYNEYDATGRVTRQREFNPRIDAPNTNRIIYELSYSGADPVAPGSESCTVVKNYSTVQSFTTQKMCFNVSGLKIFDEDGAGNITRMAYDASGMTTSITDPSGALHQYTFDGRRRLTQEILPDTAEWHTTVTYSYENNFNKLVQKEERATSRIDVNIPVATRTTQYEINPANGSVTRITDHLNHSESFVYDQYGNATRHVNKNGAITNYTYDANGNYQTRKTIQLQQADGSNQTVTTQYTYDSYGNKLTETMPNGALYTYEYDTVGNLRKTTDPTGAVTIFRYDLESHKISQTDALGHVTNYVYDTDIEESLLSTERVGGNGSLIERNEYDFLGRVTRQIDPRGNATRYVRDSAGRVIQRVEPLTTMSIAYDVNGNVIQEIRGVGVLDQRVDYTYDARNNLVSVRRYNTDGSFVTEIYAYDGFNRKITSTDGNGGVTRYSYDLAGKLTSIIDPSGSESRYFYDAEGNKIGELSARALADAALRNSNGHTLTYQYDELNRLIKKTNALNKVSLMFYDEQGHVVRTIDNQDSNGGAADHITRFEFNSRGLKTRQIDANGNAVVYEYDSLGNLTRQVDAMNRATTYVYNEFGQLVEERNAAGNSARYAYDANGNKISVTLADGTVTTSVFDAQNRLTRITDAAGQSENYAYDVVGNKTRVTSKRGAVSIFTYNSLNRLVREENAQNTITSYTYDNNGNRLTESTNNVVKSYQFDLNNRVTRIIHPGNKTESFVYDANGNVMSKTDGNGAVTSFTYDALDRTTQKRHADNSVVSYLYDNWNNVVQLTEPVGVTNYTFDAGNRFVTERKTLSGIDGNSYTVSRTYNPDNQLASLTDAANKQVTYSYTNVGLLSSVLYQNQPLATYAYNTNGKPTSLTYRNGIVQSYLYDSLQRPTRLLIQNAQQQTLFSHNYSYDAESNRTQTIEVTAINGDSSNRTIDYSYDTVNQLTGLNYSDIAGNSDISFAYDARGNRVSLSTPLARMGYSYTNGTEELAQYSTNDRMSVSMTYDGNGALTRESFSRFGKSQKNVDYRWSAQNRLSQITVTDTTRPEFLPNLPVNTLDFAYDDAGNRIKKTVNNTDTTYYLNNGLVVLNELNGSGVISKTIVQGLNEQIAQIDAQGVVTFSHSDTQGTVLMLSNEQGAVVQQFDYDPFGALIGNVSAAGLSAESQSRYLYTNQEFDVESNLYYYNARYYNPVIGRFISRDIIPGNIGDTLSRNAYIYVKNNPLRYTDPSGLWFDDLLDSVSSFASGVSNTISNAAVAVKDTVVDTAVAVKKTVSQVTTSVVNTVSNVQWKTVGVGLGQAALGGLQTVFGGLQVAGGVAIATGGTATGIGAVPGIAGGIAVGAMGANNVVAGATQTASGFSTIWNGLNGKTDIVDKTYNPAHEAIAAVTDKGSTANTILTLGYDAIDIVVGGSAVQKGINLLSKTKQATTVTEGLYKVTLKSGEQYIGQSGTIDVRLSQHLNKEKFLLEDIKSIERSEVLGGKTAREIAEQSAILDAQKNGITLLNKVNPVGGRPALFQQAESMLVPQFSNGLQSINSGSTKFINILRGGVFTNSVLDQK